MKAILALLLAAIASVLIAFHVGQRRLIYFPDATLSDAAVPANFELTRPDGVILYDWADRGGQPRALLYFGGNGESLQVARAQLAGCCPGWSAYFLPYRGYGGSDGQPACDAILADALAFHDAVAKWHPDQPITVIGRSLGSGVGTWVGNQRSLSKLMLITPFDSLGNVAKVHYPWLPIDWLLDERYDNGRGCANMRRRPRWCYAHRPTT